MRWVRALALIVAGLLVMLAGAEQVRPASDQSGEPWRLERLNHQDSQIAELHQILELHRVCTETGRWDQWPCTRFGPNERVTPQG